MMRPIIYEDDTGGWDCDDIADIINEHREQSEKIELLKAENLELVGAHKEEANRLWGVIKELNNLIHDLKSTITENNQKLFCLVLDSAEAKQEAKYYRDVFLKATEWNWLDDDAFEFIPSSLAAAARYAQKRVDEEVHAETGIKQEESSK